MGFKLTTEQFIEKAQQIHSQKYDYQLVDYKNAHAKVKIICHEHGIFEQKPCKHLKQMKCPKCALSQRSKKRALTLDEFIERANIIHNNKYDYSKVNYINNITKVEIICPIHGIFKQIPSAHLKGHSCSKCRNIISNSEIELHNFLKILNISFITNDRKFLENTQELDILIHSHKVAIEFNGNWWHYDKSNPNCKPKGYHGNKSKLCKKKGYKLFHLREDLWKKNKEKMKKVIKKLLE